jgi:monoamine oxidase
MVEEVDRELREIHDVRYTPPPYAAAYMDWGVDPYGGGVNFWNIHARSPEIIPRMTQPVPEVPVYVCGEAYSNGQGWVEGALETAELVLQNHFGLAPPEWLT